MRYSQVLRQATTFISVRSNHYFLKEHLVVNFAANVTKAYVKGFCFDKVVRNKKSVAA